MVRAAILNRAQERRTSDQSATQLFFQNLEKHIDDIVYLVKSGKNLKTLLTDIFNPTWKKNYFSNEKTILNQYGTPYITRSISKCYKEWLEEKTTYADIISRTLKTDSGRSYRHEKFRLPLQKRTLQRIFSIAGRLFTGFEKGGKVIRATVDEDHAFFVVYEDLDKRINVLFSKIRSEFVVGKTRYCVVQEMIDLKSKQSLALKYARQEGEEEALSIANQTMRHEARIACAIKSVCSDPGLSLPHGVVLDGDFRGIISHRYRGDCIQLYDTLGEDSTLLLRDVLEASLGLAQALVELTAQECVHGDFKPDNIFYDIIEGERPLLFALSDFNLSMSFKDIIRIKFFSRHLPKYRLGEDLRSIESLIKSGASDVEVGKVIEKQEVYAFGKTLLEIMTNTDLKANFSIVDRKNEFIQMYGEGLYDFFEGMLQNDHAKRFTFLEVSESLKENLRSCSAVLEERFVSLLKRDRIFRLFGWEQNYPDNSAIANELESDDYTKFHPAHFFPNQEVSTKLTLRL